MRLFPLTQWQRHLLAVQHHPKSTTLFRRHGILAETLRVQPRIDERRLRRAFDHLCRRHDTTRLQFRPFGGDWKCALVDTHAVGLEVHDYAGSDPEQMRQLSIKHAREIILMEDAALVRLDLLKFGPLGDVVILRAHNAIVDGFGLTVLVKDLVSYVMGVPLIGQALSYEAYLTRWGRDAVEGTEAREAYWRDRLLPPPTPPHLGRLKAGLGPLVDGETWQSAKDLVVTLRKAELEVLEAQAKAAGVSVFILLNTAFVEMLARRGSVPELLYSLNMGRFERELMHYAGYHTFHPLMRHTSTPHLPTAQIAQRVSQELTEMLAHFSIDAARSGGEWDRKIRALGGYPRQFVTGSNVPAGRTGKTMFKGLFSITPGQEWRIGPMTLSTFEMPPETGDIDELGFRLNLIGASGKLSFKYDAAAYDDDEIIAMAADVFALVGMDLPAWKVITGSDSRKDKCAMAY